MGEVEALAIPIKFSQLKDLGHKIYCPSKLLYRELTNASILVVHRFLLMGSFTT